MVMSDWFHALSAHVKLPVCKGRNCCIFMIWIPWGYIPRCLQRLKSITMKSLIWSV